MPKLNLEEHRNLFRDEAAFQEFVALLQKVTENFDISPVWGQEHHVATIISPAGFQALFGGRMLQKLIEQPSMLEELRKKLETVELEPTH